MILNKNKFEFLLFFWQNIQTMTDIENNIVPNHWDKANKHLEKLFMKIYNLCPNFWCTTIMGCFFFLGWLGVNDMYEYFDDGNPKTPTIVPRGGIGTMIVFLFILKRVGIILFISMIIMTLYQLMIVWYFKYEHASSRRLYNEMY
jgi:hypothetical protein